MTAGVDEKVERVCVPGRMYGSCWTLRAAFSLHRSLLSAFMAPLTFLGLLIAQPPFAGPCSL